MIYILLESTPCPGMSHDEVVAIISKWLSCLVSQTFPGTGLAVNTFRNLISSWILRDRVFMTAGWKNNTFNPF
jgi:hypothetical protein